MRHILVCVIDYSMIVFFFFNDTATTEIYTLSLHDALPICEHGAAGRLELVLPEVAGVAPEARHRGRQDGRSPGRTDRGTRRRTDRKSTRLNSSHANISYAVFCLKKKKTKYSYLTPHTIR